LTGQLLLYVGSVVIAAWGIAHIAPTRSVVAGFGQLSDDNRRIITMEWIAEGLALIFIGVLCFLVTLLVGPGDAVARLVYRVSAAMLLVMAVWTLVTGARTSVVFFKICPTVKAAVAALLIAGSVL
jgi:hypothetical protein